MRSRIFGPRVGKSTSCEKPAFCVAKRKLSDITCCAQGTNQLISGKLKSPTKKTFCLELEQEEINLHNFAVHFTEGGLYIQKKRYDNLYKSITIHSTSELSFKSTHDAGIFDFTKMHTPPPTPRRSLRNTTYSAPSNIKASGSLSLNQVSDTKIKSNSP